MIFCLEKFVSDFGVSPICISAGIETTYIHHDLHEIWFMNYIESDLYIVYIIHTRGVRNVHSLKINYFYMNL